MRNPRPLALRATAGLIALATAATLAGCSTEAEAGSTASAGDPFKALVITNGPENDKSWSNSVYDGVMGIDDPDIEVSFIGSLTETADIVQQASAYAGEGYDMIVISNGAQAAAATQLAEQFPDTTVCQGPWSPTDEELAAMPDNQCVWNIKQQDGTFLAGVVAGLVTKTNKLASVAGGEFPAVIRQPEGFVLGARCVNPEATIDIQYTGSFDDVAAAQSAATTQVADGADVILSAVDGAVSGLYGAARDAASPTYVIPSYYDSYDSASDVVLTSVLYNLGGVTADMIEKGAAGEIGAHAYLPYNYANLEVGELADFHGNPAITPEIQATLEDVQAKLRDGSIVVPDEVGADAPLSVDGAGSTIDPASIGC
ncbi:BMP family protein [Herbiconiux sp. VKM Ac-2851]|uniref:BMP family lipoprotein n=1 Tax=Herbiconiux sp. VKM Ac-2851 TaxID=2739025 RepID=UPI00156596F2|nr:BMP family ABC transporter substrate-binding protein [Herbiconiux sp. VKM Ac-2851]NQX35108.1 BMP family ABC transporter substrate-binding protein [Herbiconiux sp. VKM Ac-2851]